MTGAPVEKASRQKQKGQNLVTYILRIDLRQKEKDQRPKPWHILRFDFSSSTLRFNKFDP